MVMGLGKGGLVRFEGGITYLSSNHLYYFRWTLLSHNLGRKSFGLICV